MKKLLDWLLIKPLPKPKAGNITLTGKGDLKISLPVKGKDWSK